MSKTKILGILAVVVLIVAAMFTQTELLKGTLDITDITQIESEISSVMQEQESFKAQIADLLQRRDAEISDVLKGKEVETESIREEMNRELEDNPDDERLREELNQRLEERMTELNLKYEQIVAEIASHYDPEIEQFNRDIENLESRRLQLMEQYTAAEQQLAKQAQEDYPTTSATPEASPEATPNFFECTDTDPNDDSAVKGNAKYGTESLWDYCAEDGKTLYQAQCPSTTIAAYGNGIVCEYGCSEGACNNTPSSSPAATAQATATPSASATATPTPTPKNTSIIPNSTSPRCTARLRGNENIINTTYKGNGSGGNNYYIWTDGSVDAAGGGGNAVYIKTGGTFNGNGGGSNTIFYENGANIINEGGSAALTLCGEVIFEKDGKIITPPKQLKDSAGALTISSNADMVTTHVIGEQDVKLFTITLTAGPGSPVTVNTIGFSAIVNNNEDTSGWSKGVDTDGNSTVSAASMINWIKLYDGTTQISSPESPNSTTGEFTFTGTSLVIPKNTSKTLTLKANLSKNSTHGKQNDSLGIIFDNTKTIDARDSQGNKVAATTDPSGVNTRNGNWQKDGPYSYITVNNQGRININPPLVQVPSKTLILGEKEVKLAEFSMNAEMESFFIPRLTLMHVKGVSNLTIKYPDKNGAVKKATTVVSQATSVITFDSLDLYVPENKEITVEVYADIIPYFSQSITNFSGETVQINWPGLDNYNYFQAVGENSSRTINNSGSTITTSTHMTRRSQLSATFPQKKENIIYGVEADVTKINLTAGPQQTDQAELYQMTFDIETTGIDTNRITAQNAWKIYDATNPTTALSYATYDNGKVRFTFDGQNTKSTPIKISGTGSTFLIRGPILEDFDQSTTGSLKISLTQDKDFGKTNTVATVNAQSSTLNNFIWSDISSSAHALNTTDWANGYTLNLSKDSLILE